MGSYQCAVLSEDQPTLSDEGNIQLEGAFTNTAAATSESVFSLRSWLFLVFGPPPTKAFLISPWNHSTCPQWLTCRWAWAAWPTDLQSQSGLSGCRTALLWTPWAIPWLFHRPHSTSQVSSFILSFQSAPQLLNALLRMWDSYYNNANPSPLHWSEGYVFTVTVSVVSSA